MSFFDLDSPLPAASRLYSHHGVTHGSKAYELSMTWDEVKGVLTIWRDTVHQLHEVKVEMREGDDGAGGVKMTPYFTIREADHPTGITMERTYDLFTLVHLLVNISKDEVLDIANREFR